MADEVMPMSYEGDNRREGDNERRQTDVELAMLRQDMQRLNYSLQELKGQVSELLDAWNTANGLVRFIKWTAGLVAALGVIWAIGKDHIR